jgi:hypothetical protein
MELPEIMQRKMELPGSPGKFLADSYHNQKTMERNK